MEEFLKMLSKLLKIRPKVAPTIPGPLILLSQNRPGMSALNVAMRIQAKKAELGLPVGNYEDGSANHNDIIILETCKQLIAEFQENSKITVIIPPGTQVIASGGNAGGPVVCYGNTITPTTGYAVIQ